jgi:hypothetical protein
MKTETTELSLYSKIKIESSTNVNQWSEIIATDLSSTSVRVQLRHHNAGIEKPYYKNLMVDGKKTINIPSLGTTVKVGLTNNDQPTLTAEITYPEHTKWYKNN